ncbi:hypothetical protein QAD02_001728 [Eretmocerus hayati]|uniref:Uncharacterized protein n=1 Tax=Eretmocerus hayati TaxID=131215 RepID=A0ACC2NH77_9HYME|nr:hypothetical protein QAD02_001728 [Eretmocerus hayati]
MGPCDSKLVLLVIFSMIMENISCTELIGESAAVNHIANYIRNNLTAHKVNIVIECVQQLSPSANSIIQKVSGGFPSEVFDFKTATKNNSSELSQMPLSTIQKMVSERYNLVIGVLEIRSGNDTFKQLKNLSGIVKAFIRDYHSKFLILVLNSKCGEFERFLRAAWTWRFLDLTIIELIESTSNRSTEWFETRNNDTFGVVHEFNPFFNEYRVQQLTIESVLFPDKSKDFNGYTFRAMVYKYKPQDYITNRFPTLNTGHDYLMYLAILQKLNVTEKSVHYGDEYDEWEVRSSDVGVTYGLGDVVDFMVEYEDRVMVRSHLDRDYILVGESRNIFLPTLVSFHFLVKRQIRSSPMEISKEALLAYAAILLTGIFFASYARVLGFKVKNWSIINIMTAQMGGSLEVHRPMRMSEKIYLIMMYITTFTVTTIATDYMLQIFIYHQKTSDLTTLKELADSNLDFILDETDYEFLRPYEHDPDVVKILKRTKPAEVSDGYSGFCGLNVMYGKVDDSINLCLLSSRDEIPVLRLNGEWYIDRIEQPINTVYPSYFTEFNTLPSLMKNFEFLITRFVETGFTQFWAEQYQRDLISHTLERGGDASLLTNREIKNDGDTEEPMPLKYQLLAIMLAGASISVFALFCEIILSHLMRETELGNLIQAFKRRSRKMVNPSLNITKPLQKSKILSQASGLPSMRTSRPPIC